MNNFNNLIVQQGNNEYRVWTPHGICVAHIVCPPDGQYILDSKTLEYICRALAYRWDFISKNKQ